MIKKIITTIFLMITFSVINFANAQSSLQSSSRFEKSLSTIGYSTEQLKQQTSLSRYEVTRLLNLVECIDCILPSSSLIDTYTQPFWTQFLTIPGKDFRDIRYKQAIYNNESYYYCVATVADNEYMYGYPLLTSPICPGLFCGARAMTQGEFVQVVINIATNYIASSYTTNRNTIQNRLENQIPGSYNANIFNNQDRSLITTQSALCSSTNCTIPPSAFRTYLKYCMFNLESCEMKPLGWIQQGYRPVAELNTIEKEDLIPNINSLINNLYKPIDGKTAVEVLGRLFDKVGCNFDDDYDCDGIANHLDNCPYHFNPYQTDTDGDGIGDVCDDDIDGDGINNPINIVDNRGEINIKNRENGTDNCIIIPNTPQTDTNNNNIGDICDQRLEGVNIKSRIIGSDFNRRIHVTVVTDYTPIEDNRTWTINNMTFLGKELYFPTQETGLYRFEVVSTKDPRRKASTTMFIDKKKIYGSLYLTPTLSTPNFPTILTSTAIGTQGHQYLRTLTSPDMITSSITSSIDQSYRSILRQTGEYTLSAINQNTKGENIAISSVRFTIDNNNNYIYPITLTTTETQPNKPILFSINSDQDIRGWIIDRGDGTNNSLTSKNTNHTYSNPGTYVISSQIISRSGKRQYNLLTINITDPTTSSHQDAIMNIDYPKLSYDPMTLISWDKQRIGYTDDDVRQNRLFLSSIEYPIGGLSNNNIISSNRPAIITTNHIDVIDTCKVTNHSATLIVQSTNYSCFEMKVLGIPPQCDFNNNGIDDRCDDDIDGDGFLNPIGLIQENHVSCNITQASIDREKYDSMMSLISQHNNKNGLCTIPLDNCPLSPNPLQDNICGDIEYNFEDTKNGTQINGQDYGSGGLSIMSWIDSDGDGIPDDRDQCPNLKETYNNYQDDDGCPEIGAEDICSIVAGESESIIEAECLMCPCQYAQETNDIQPGDRIRSTLRNLSGDFLQTWSNELLL